MKNYLYTDEIESDETDLEQYLAFISSLTPEEEALRLQENERELLMQESHRIEKEEERALVEREAWMGNPAPRVHSRFIFY